MFLFEIIILVVFSLAVIGFLSVVAVEVISEKLNPTPKTNNSGPKFYEVPNILVHEVYNYKVK